ncbi:SMI1/KNR4 family protein [Bacillus sp. UMB0728]|uniref:SMI1/KNR4 family protein n=1 Tax=Bacillus sp. UMB0728 TaxID=2066052 RepID=UPI000C78C903|nr:SMI1/KNR4 family protein [Bacillus sp. UMB0728]PLR70679.1 SMI1/KNR4 family protein [Bacillus sp. UMB0728]
MKNIWQEDDEYYKLKPLTDKEVEKAENKLKVKLPKSYIYLLKEQNGGYINYNSFPSNVPTSWADDHINIEHILGIGEENSILESEYLIKEWGLPKNIVLISGSGHSWVALDYRNIKEEPPVIYIDMDSDQIIELAPDFDIFINGLYVEETELEAVYYEQEERNWTPDELNIALSTADEQEIILALNYLYENTKGNEHFIEQKLIVLLQNPAIDIKQIAVNFASHFNEIGILSSKGVKEMISIIRKDKEIDYYADMYFSES